MEKEVELEEELRKRLKSGIAWEDLFISLLDPKQECKINRHVVNRFLARIEFLGKKIFEYESGIKYIYNFLFFYFLFYFIAMSPRSPNLVSKSTNSFRTTESVDLSVNESNSSKYSNNYKNVNNSNAHHNNDKTDTATLGARNWRITKHMIISYVRLTKRNNTPTVEIEKETPPPLTRSKSASTVNKNNANLLVSPTHRTARENWALLKNLVIVMRAFEDKGIYTIENYDDLEKDIENFVPTQYTNEEMFRRQIRPLRRSSSFSSFPTQSNSLLNLPETIPENNNPTTFNFSDNKDNKKEIEKKKKEKEKKRPVTMQISPEAFVRPREYSIPQAISKEVFDEAVEEIKRESEWFSCCRIGGNEEIKRMREIANKDPKRYYQKYDRRRLVNSVDDDNCTALYIACQNGNSSLVEILLDMNIDPRICAITNIKPHLEESPLECSARWGYFNIVSIFYIYLLIY